MDLIIQWLTFDKQRPNTALRCQRSIPCQKHAVLSKRQTGQLMIIQSRVKECIVAKDA